MIEIDGSHGEGGGQILRTALALSCLCGRPFRIVNIRKGRKRPGLSPQHLASVRAAKAISGAETEGDREGSCELLFSPGEVKAGEIALDVGTAGSTLLVLQTVVPALLFARGKSTVTIRGGTHVPFSPSFTYAERVLVPTLARIGVRVSLAIDSYGFYPKGGGTIRAVIDPADRILPLRLMERGRILAVRGESATANLPRTIAERQRDAAMMVLRAGMPSGTPAAEIEVRSVPGPAPGTFLFLSVETEHAVAGFASLGTRGKRAEEVGEEAASALVEHCREGGALDPHLADQIVVFLALCGDGSEFTTSQVTGHLATNLWTIGRFREISHAVEGEIGGPGRVTISGGSAGGFGPEAGRR